MSSKVSYNGDVVNAAISDISQYSNKFASLSKEIKQSTNDIITSKGFQEYIGGITSDTFSSAVDSCEQALEELVNDIRKQQINILKYSEDKEAIKVFIDSLSVSEYRKLDLSELEDYISTGKKVGNFLKGAGADVLTGLLGLTEGVLDFGETAADLISLSAAVIATPFTFVYDSISGDTATEDLWEDTKSRVSKKSIETLYDNLYANTSVGQFCKENAYGFDIVRSVSKGLGYTAGIIGVSMVTGGLVNGGFGAAGTISAGNLGATAGIMGFSNGTEEAWYDGATLGRGLAYGAATGIWEGVQWYAGAKINQFGGAGDKIARGIFKGGRSGVGIRIAMDGGVAGLEGFVRPALSMIYKDYKGATIADQYKTAFQAAGGWKGVGTQVAIGVGISALTEFTGARKLLKAAEGEPDHSKSVFERRPDNLPDSYRYMEDGSYLPPGAEGGEAVASARGVFAKVEKNMTAAEMLALIDANKGSLSDSQYQALVATTKVLEREGLPVNLNALKLIAGHSEGNVARIRTALALSYADVPDEVLDDLSDQLAKEVFQSSGPRSFSRMMQDDFITTLQEESRDKWMASKRMLIFEDPEALTRAIAGENVETTLKNVKSFFGDGLSEEAALRIAQCDGYPQTIRAILQAEGIVAEDALDEISNRGAATIFRTRNLARMKAMSSIAADIDYDTALRLTGDGTMSDEAYKELMKATHVFSPNQETRSVYYRMIDQFMEEGASLEEATLRARNIDAQALTELGKDSSFLFRSAATLGEFTIEDAMYRWNSGVLDGVDDGIKAIDPPKFVTEHYLQVDGSTDIDRLAADFESVMRKNDSTLKAAARRKGYSFNASATRESTDFFIRSYVEAAKDSTSPYHAEAVAFMGKVLELDQSGKPLVILNNMGLSTDCSGSGVINISTFTAQQEASGTVFHETGHYVFEQALGEQVPEGFESARQSAIAHLRQESDSLMRAFAQNEREVDFYTHYQADKAIEASVQRQGFATLGEYRTSLAEQYASASAGARRASLGQTLQEGGGDALTKYDEMVSSLDIRNAEECAMIEISEKRATLKDAIYRRDFGEYARSSGIIDSASKGEIRIHYGHGKKYFNGGGDRRSYTEIIADYSSSRVSGDTGVMSFLRRVFGDQFMDMIDETYHTMLS